MDWEMEKIMANVHGCKRYLQCEDCPYHLTPYHAMKLAEERKVTDYLPCGDDKCAFRMEKRW